MPLIPPIILRLHFITDLEAAYHKNERSDGIPLVFVKNVDNSGGVEFWYTYTSGSGWFRSFKRKVLYERYRYFYDKHFVIGSWSQ